MIKTYDVAWRRDPTIEKKWRDRDIRIWWQQWDNLPPCPVCHQEHGRPCLNLSRTGPAVHKDKPHPNRNNPTEGT